jgi:hypothetical protein
MRFVGLISGIMLLLSIFMAVGRRPKGKHVSISEHVASERWKYLLFGSLVTVFGSLFIWFLYNWLGPHIGVPPVWAIVMTTSEITMLITVWVPHNDNKLSAKVHWYVSMVLAAMVVTIVFCIAISRNINLILRVLAFLVAVWGFLTVYIFIFVKKLHKYYLIFQIIALISSLLVITLASVF